MAEKRMFAKTIVDSDAFIEMPSSARLLYYDLGMRADDDGFVNSPKKIMRMTGAGEDDLKILIAKKFIIPFENGIVVLKHWKIHNYIRKDTYRETPYLDEKSMLELDENNAYRMKSVDDPSTQYSIDKNRLDKISIDKYIYYGEYKNVFFTNEQYEKLKEEFSDYQERIDKLDNYMQSKGVKYKDCLATIRNWSKKEKTKQTNMNNYTKREYTNLNSLYANK